MILSIALMLIYSVSFASIVIATKDAAGHFQIILAQKKLQHAFNLIFPNSNTQVFQLSQEKNTYYLYSEDAKGIYRIQLKLNANQDLLSVEGIAIVGESCGGDPCSKCSFASGGGCSCSGTLAGKCNHTISRFGEEIFNID